MVDASLQLEVPSPTPTLQPNFEVNFEVPSPTPTSSDKEVNLIRYTACFNKDLVFFEFSRVKYISFETVADGIS